MPSTFDKKLDLSIEIESYEKYQRPNNESAAKQ